MKYKKIILALSLIISNHVLLAQPRQDTVMTFLHNKVVLHYFSNPKTISSKNKRINIILNNYSFADTSQLVKKNNNHSFTYYYSYNDLDSLMKNFKENKSKKIYSLSLYQNLDTCCEYEIWLEVSNMLSGKIFESKSLGTIRYILKEKKWELKYNNKSS